MMENTKADAMLTLAYAIQVGLLPVAVVGRDPDGELYVGSSQPRAQTVAALRQALEWLEGAVEPEEATKTETP
jgi:hypothetical protein